MAGFVPPAIALDGNLPWTTAVQVTRHGPTERRILQRFMRCGLAPTRVLCRMQRPTDHDYAISTRGY